MNNMKEREDKHAQFEAIFHKSHTQFLIVGLLFSIVGLSADSVDYFLNNTTFLLFINLFSLGLLLFSFVGFILKKVNKQTSAVILIYTMVLNILLSNAYFFVHSPTDWQLYILRGTIIISIYITITALLLNKTHIIIINILYFTVLIIIRYFSHTPNFISQQAFFLIILMAAFSYALYLFNHLLKISLEEKKRLDDLVFKQEKKAMTHKNEVIKIKAQHLEELIKLKNKELVSKTLAITQNNDYKKKLIKRLEGFLNKVPDDVETELIDLLSEMSASEKSLHWKEFHKRFEEVHQDFFKKILNTSPNLTPSELKLAAFVRLGLSTKEISILTNNNVSSIEVARSRLRKKMRLKTSDNLATYLSKV